MINRNRHEEAVRRLILIAAASALTFVLALAIDTAFASMNREKFAEGVVRADGSLRVPDDFRETYAYLGSWAVADDVDTNGSIGLHVVYAQRFAVRAHQQTGKFPDGTVLVKELFNGKSEDLTTGRATSANGVAGYFVMVKDTKGRFPENPLWGDGWGWSFFEAGSPEKAVTKDYTGECLACHEPARQTDLVYDYAYPVLQK
ncbi:MAG: cytochrome P460 family protein [Rhodospirillales bacterium]